MRTTSSPTRLSSIVQNSLNARTYQSSALNRLDNSGPEAYPESSFESGSTSMPASSWDGVSVSRSFAFGGLPRPRPRPRPLPLVVRVLTLAGLSAS